MATAKKVEQLSQRVRDKESELSEAKGRLEATKQEARDKYGTDDEEQLQKKIKKREKEKEKLESEKQNLESEIEKELEEIENEEDDE